ncbi:MAG: GNAT family N-acetyltransferase [Ruminococcaceae bacterium]|nr:GNAT family N-acetyltransferase [Oscillospiraceae bacterium]
MMKIRYAKEADIDLVRQIDSTVTKTEFKRWTDNAQVLLIYEKEAFAGWLQYSLFLEKIPFVNRFYILEEYRGLGDGKLSLLIWQRMMEERFFDEVMLSCGSDNEKAQKLFESIGYRKIGALDLVDGKQEFVYKKTLPKPEI